MVLRYEKVKDGKGTRLITERERERDNDGQHFLLTREVVVVVWNIVIIVVAFKRYVESQTRRGVENDDSREV